MEKYLYFGSKENNLSTQLDSIFTELGKVHLLSIPIYKLIYFNKFVVKLDISNNLPISDEYKFVIYGKFFKLFECLVVHT